LTVTRDEQQYTKTTTNKEGAKEMSKTIEVVDDCFDALCHALDEIEAIDDSLRCAALDVLSAYHSAPDEKRPEFEETLMSLGETVDAILCLKGSVEALHKRIAKAVEQAK
jgi:hypothetical protein